MSLRAYLMSTVAVLVLSSLACGGDPPDKEIQQAQGAIATARAAGADRYAAEEFTAAETALKNATAAVEQRDYRLALNHALDSRERAENAAKQAADAKAAARLAADRALKAAEAKLKAAETAHGPARTAADSREHVIEAQRRVQEARTAFEGGDYFEALRGASAATEALKPLIEAPAGSGAPNGRRKPGSH